MSDGWHLVRTPELSVIEERMPPGAREERHSHRLARQFFFVLSGNLTMQIEEDVHGLSAGEGLEVRPGAAHQARNESEENVRFLVISVPPAQGDRLARI